MQAPPMHMVLSKGPLLVSFLVKVHYSNIPLLAVDSASAADLLLSTTAPGLGYLHQTPDALETKNLVKFHLTCILRMTDLHGIKFILKNNKTFLKCTTFQR